MSQVSPDVIHCAIMIPAVLSRKGKFDRVPNIFGFWKCVYYLIPNIFSKQVVTLGHVSSVPWCYSLRHYDPSSAVLWRKEQFDQVPNIFGFRKCVYYWIPNIFSLSRQMVTSGHVSSVPWCHSLCHYYPSKQCCHKKENSTEYWKYSGLENVLNTEYRMYSQQNGHPSVPWCHSLGHYDPVLSQIVKYWIPNIFGLWKCERTRISNTTIWSQLLE